MLLQLTQGLNTSLKSYYRHIAELCFDHLDLQTFIDKLLDLDKGGKISNFLCITATGKTLQPCFCM